MEVIKDWLVVIASIRDINPAFLESIPTEVPVLVVDDSDGNIRSNRPNMTVVRYKDQRDYLGEYDDLVVKKSPSCKSFGLIYAYREGYRRVIGLDDDCDTRTCPDFMTHADLVGKTIEVDCVSSANGWFNPCSLLVNGRMYSRGYPYELRGVDENYVREKCSGRVVFNAGLWTGTPDINGIDKLNREVPEDNMLKESSIGLARGTVFPLSIMNYQILAECIPAFYQPPDFRMPDDFQIRRHDDVWSGLILKLLADIRGDVVTLGQPLVRHSKRGDTHKEILSEHFSNLIHQDFIRTVERVMGRVRAGSYHEMFAQVGEGFLAVGPDSPFKIYREVYRILGEKVGRWAGMFARFADVRHGSEAR
jgi:hypothetical protein